MSMDERYGTRDLTFSTWHRYALPARATAIDLDLIEYCQRCRMPLCLIESARDIGQDSKPTIVLQELAKIANVVAICVLYTPDGTRCLCRHGRIADGCTHGISSFRVRQVHPADEPFETWQPWELAVWLTTQHDNHEGAVCQYKREVFAG